MAIEKWEISKNSSLEDGWNWSSKNECLVKKNVGFKLPKHGHFKPKHGGFSSLAFTKSILDFIGKKCDDEQEEDLQHATDTYTKAAVGVWSRGEVLSPTKTRNWTIRVSPTGGNIEA